MKIHATVAVLVSVLGAVAAELDDGAYLRFREVEAHVDKHTDLLASASNDVFTKILCSTSEAASYFGYKCKTSTTSSTSTSDSSGTTSTPTTATTTTTTETPLATETPAATTTVETTAPTPTATVSTTATYDLHALAIGDWGVDLGLGSCCNKYRQTGTGNSEYYKDQQAQPNVAYLLSLSAAALKPKVIMGHGFYWNGLASKDVNYRFTNNFEQMYNQESLKDIKWVNVMGNHDYGGSMFICGEYDNQFYECTSEADLLKQLEEKFTRQANYVSPNGDRWKMPARYYVETIKDAASGVTVDIFNVDTNAATVHGGEQICCQCYGYLSKYGSADKTVNCNNVHRGHAYCAGGDTNLFDSCLNKIKGWQADSLTQLKRDAKASTATWKVVNSHYSPHFHMEPTMMQEWFDALADTGVHVFINGHTHAESHEWATFNTHFVTNGAGGGIQSESIGSPPPYATDVSTVWIGANAPYGIFEMSFGKQQMRLRFMTFDDNWVFNAKKSDTVKGGSKVGHCWLIPIDGSKGAAC